MDLKVQILYDDRLETLWAFGVKAKGVTTEVVSWIMSKLEEAGYNGTEITIQTDQEESATRSAAHPRQLLPGACAGAGATGAGLSCCAGQDQSHAPAGLYQWMFVRRV